MTDPPAPPRAARRLRLLAGGLAVATGLAAPARAQPAPSEEEVARWEAMAARVTIHRDAWGVPHIVGPTDASVMFGAAFARAEDRLFEDERFFLSALGRLAELDGEAAVPADRLRRAFRTSDVARREYAESPPGIRAMVEAYADGVNYWLYLHPEARFRVLERFEPWWPFAFNRFDPPLELAGLAEALPFRPPAPGPARGSNAWAVGPSRTASGNAMLFANPHMPFDAPYEFHVMSDEGLNVSGITAYGIVGLPIIGRTDRLGWSHTVNYADVLDVYRLAFDDPDDPLAYRYGDGTRQAEEWVETFRVRRDETAGGGFEERSITLRRSHHGPVVEYGGAHYAVRRANQDLGSLFPQYYAMAKARGLEEFRSALDMKRLAYHNIVYADADGNIFYAYLGAHPDKSPDVDWEAPVDGSDPALDWRGVIDLDEVPTVLNPASGWVQNANSSPFHASGEGDNPDPADYPPYLVREARVLGALSPLVDSLGNGLRARRSRQILGSETAITLDRWTELATDPYMLAADEELPGLFQAWDALEDPVRREALREPIDSLRAWDRRGAAESVATTLFVLWREAVFSPPAAVRGQGLERLEAAISTLESDRGTWRVAWGDINRHQRPSARIDRTYEDDLPSLPLAAANANVVGSIITATSARPEGQTLRYGQFGNTYVAVMEFREDGVRARAIVPYGQSADPDSPHFFDQAPLFARGELRASWFTIEEVLGNAEESYRPGERSGGAVEDGG